MLESAVLLNVAWVTAAIVAAAVIVTYVPAIVIKRARLARLAVESRGKLVLTFDDGPDPSLTPKLLNLLKQYNAKATFYFLGFRAVRSPGMCDLIAAHGHELGCHGQMHLNAWRTAPWRAMHNVNVAYRNMARWVRRDAPFRPPYGKLTTWVWIAAAARGASIDFWTCDGGDTHEILPRPEAIVELLIAANGGVVLLHSHDRGIERERYVLQVTEQLLMAARRHGLQICTMEKLHGR